MITGDSKPLEDVLAMVERHDKIIVAGCYGCVTVCRVGGEKEVQVLSSALRLARESQGRPIEIKEVTLERQCDPEYVETMRPYVQDYEAVVSIACGAGVQFLAEHFSKIPIYPGINTAFIGVAEAQGVWAERCQACGDCILHLTGGICPIARCSKTLMNGPCGGTKEGKCEVSDEMDCAWYLIVERMKMLGTLDKLSEVLPPRDWSTSRDGGPRRVSMEHIRAYEEREGEKTEAAGGKKE